MLPKCSCTQDQKTLVRFSDVKGQGWLVTEFWLRQSSSLDVGLKKITVFIAKRQPAQASRQRAENSDFW